jgi:nitroreductase
MSIINAIRERRSHKLFTNRPIFEDEIRALIDAAVLAPNHKLTQPWGFVVLGRRARQRYAEIKANWRVQGEANDEFAAAKREKIIAQTAGVPAVIVITQKLNADLVRREEDYAAIFMGIENMLLLATSMKLGSKVHTGGVMEEPEMHKLIGAAQDERIVAIVHIGEPAEEVPAKVRIPSAEKTRWLP